MFFNADSPQLWTVQGKVQSPEHIQDYDDAADADASYPETEVILPACEVVDVEALSSSVPACHRHRHYFHNPSPSSSYYVINCPHHHHQKQKRHHRYV